MEAPYNKRKRKERSASSPDNSDTERTTTRNKRPATEVPELPLEVVCVVLGWVGVADLVRAKLVCRDWHALIASPSPSSSSSSSSSSSTFAADLWRRAYFNTWPLLGVLTSSAAGGGDSADQGGSSRPGTLASEARSSWHGEQEQGVRLVGQPDWRAIGLERLRLHTLDGRHTAENAEAVARLRGNMSRGVVGVLAALAPNTYYRRLHIAKTIVVDSGGGGGGDGGGLQDKEYAVDAVVYSATTGLPLHVALTYDAREEVSDGTPVFDDHHCPLVVFYVGVHPREAVVRPEDVACAEAVEDAFDVLRWAMLNMVAFLVGLEAPGAARLTHVEVQDYVRALLNTGDADWVVLPEFPEPGTRLPHPFVGLQSLSGGGPH